MPIIMWASNEDFSIFETSFERAWFLWRDLQTSPQIVHIRKGCTYDDNKVF